MLKFKVLKLFCILFFIIGIILLIYPIVSNKVISEKHEQLIEDYDESVSSGDISEEYVYSNAQRFNDIVREKGGYGFTLSSEDEKLYYSALNHQNNGLMGHIKIPSIELVLPIYHGSSQEVLQIGIGHIESTSLPIGGSSNHSVLTGHSGMSSAKMFTEIDKLQLGEQFIINVLGEELYYEIYNIAIVQPSETELLAIKEGEDICTLVTCTPYGANTHRLLVQGKRVQIAISATN